VREGVCVYKKCENNYSKAVLSWTKESDTSKQINNKKRYIYNDQLARWYEKKRYPEADGQERTQASIIQHHLIPSRSIKIVVSQDGLSSRVRGNEGRAGGDGSGGAVDRATEVVPSRAFIKVVWGSG